MNQITKIEDRIDRAAAGALTINGGLNFQTMNEVMEFAKLVSVSEVAVPKHLRGNPGACLALVIQAVEWGMSPYAVANKSFSVNDRLAYESQLVQAVILKRAPIKGRIKFTFDGEGPTRRCTATAVDAETGEVLEVTSPMVRDIMVKNSPLWKSDLDQQLSYYTGRALCRRYFPDVLLGIYERDEMMDVTPEPDKGEQIAARMTGATTAPGFNAESVAAEVAEPKAEKKPEPEAAKPEPSVFKVDPELSRAGAAAAVVGEPKTPPDDLDDAGRKSWLAGYEAVNDDPGAF